jgi:hypothetical protein
VVFVFLQLQYEFSTLSLLMASEMYSLVSI